MPLRSIAFGPATAPAAWLALILCAASPRSHAATFNFIVTDVADVRTGQDLWEYTYWPDGFGFFAGQGFTIYFDRDLYASLAVSPSAEDEVPDWSVLTLQPDSFLNADGYYDALALTDNPLLTGPFTVSAVWLGTGEPGAQPFEIYDTDFQPVIRGMTTGIPEPSAAILAAGTFALLCGFRRHRRIRHSGA